MLHLHWIVFHTCSKQTFHNLLAVMLTHTNRHHGWIKDTPAMWTYHRTFLPWPQNKLVESEMVGQGEFTGIMFKYRIMGIICGRKISRIILPYVVCKKTFMIQAISYIKIPAEIKSARKHLWMLPDSRNSWTFSSVDNSHHTVDWRNIN